MVYISRHPLRVIGAQRQLPAAACAWHLLVVTLVSACLSAGTTYALAREVKPMNELSMRGIKLVEQNKLSEALACFDQNLAKDPDSYWDNYGRGSVLVKHDDFAGALKALNKAVELYPAGVQAVAERAHLYIAMGKTQAAIADTKKAIILLGKAPSWFLYQDLALLHDQAGDRKQSIIDCSESLRQNPKLFWGYYFRACQYFKLGQYQKAADDLTTAAKLHSDAETIKIYSLRADCYDKLGKHDLAQKDRKFAEGYVKEGWADSLLEPNKPSPSGPTKSK